MKSLQIPVRMVGPGSHVEEEELQCLAIPRDMRTFTMPRVPESADAQALAAARDLLAGVLAKMQRWPSSHAGNLRFDLRDVPQATLDVTNDMLGDGEVSIQVNGERRLKIQESVFTGLWRAVELDADGLVVDDWIEAGPLPADVVDAARVGARADLPMLEIPPGAMNSPALLHELRGQIATRRLGDPAHVINLTLFPLTPEDHQVLERALPVGSVAIISRGFGNCRITSTAVRDIWRVQYFNSMNTLILNTIEVVDVPEVALAAGEDLDDTRERLAELIEWMSEDCAA
ncbi:MAG TPA: hydrogenase expression/formation protein [Burkholderiaceae bacterium]|nr:hydrogenase expression/formation protein [Burkholderiaceae bacterium]